MRDCVLLTPPFCRVLYEAENRQITSGCYFLHERKEKGDTYTMRQEIPLTSQEIKESLQFLSFFLFHSILFEANVRLPPPAMSHDRHVKLAFDISA